MTLDYYLSARVPSMRVVSAKAQSLLEQRHISRILIIKSGHFHVAIMATAELCRWATSQRT